MPLPPTADVLIAAECWQAQADAEDIVQRAIAAAASCVELPADETEVAVMLTDDARVRDLNREWRGQDKATNVLSFPAGPAARGQAGDIALAYGVCAAEATAQAKPLAHHLQHLTVHGVLHLFGYDHEAEDEAAIMEGLERRILARLGVPDPYAAELGAETNHV